jgi:glyoxylase-like metal-dependent hydrolase (beta-lactamase superfamily II)
VRVGSLDVAILVDGEGSFATIGDAFPALSSGEEWRLPVNAVLVRGAGPTVLIDTGLGPKPRAFMPDAGARFLAELARAGVSPVEVDLVVHTHLHVDHVGWDGSFPNARYAVSAAPIRISNTSASTTPSCRRRPGSKSSGSSPTGVPT